jgi:hypothetical protein
VTITSQVAQVLLAIEFKFLRLLLVKAAERSIYVWQAGFLLLFSFYLLSFKDLVWLLEMY